MEKPLSVLLIEDDPQECQDMVKHIEATEDIKLVGVTNNTVKALEYVTDSQPDAIILDLELHRGHGNGVSFLESLREMSLTFPIYVLVTTNNISHVTHNSVRQMGADFIMVKSQADYSPKAVIKFLTSIKNMIHSNKKAAGYSHGSESGEERRQRITNRIDNELDWIGISPNAIGRKYLIDGIMLLINGQNKRTHETIAKNYAKTEASVERAMQNAIGKAWKVTHPDDLEKYYTASIHSAKGVPTVMEFIHYYARKIKNEY